MTFLPTIARVLRRYPALLLVALAGCQSAMPTVPTAGADAVFKPAEKADHIQFADASALAALNAPTTPLQLLGKGDVLNINVWQRPELTGKQVVGPDGVVTLPLIGSVKVAGSTREGAASAIRDKLRHYYVSPSVTVAVDEYTSNRVTVLGRVQNPGVQRFEETPTVLEVLARAGALPVIDKQATLTRCAIFRGQEQMIWIDLKRLLNNGDLAQNLRLRPGDLVYVPDSFDTLVYVMGAVGKPGAYRLTPNMSVLDALSQAGGPTDDAAQQEIGIYRPSTKAVQRVPLRSLLTGDKNVNFALEEGDVLYVPKSGLADFGYLMRQISPGLSILTVGSLLMQ